MYQLLAVGLAPLLFSSTVHAIQRGCSVVDAVLELPPGQNALAVPPGTVPVSIVEGLGTQNYTCSSSGTYTALGSFAEMYDLSCLVAEAVSQGVSYQNVQNGYTWKRDANSDLLHDNLRIGCYYFIPDPQDPHNATKNIPDFDWNCGNTGILAGDPNGFMLGKKLAAIPAPAPANASFDIPWVIVQGTQGDLADFVIRVNTHGGQPPKTCQPGTPDIAVPYSAMYWLYKNESSYHALSGYDRSTSTTTTTTTTTINPTAYLSSTYLHWSSGSTPAPTSYAKAAALNAAASDPNASNSDSDSDSSKLQRLLKYAPVALGLLALATLLSLTALVISLVYLCRRRNGATMATRSVPAYHPIQLPRSGQPMMEESYHDEAKRYDA